MTRPDHALLSLLHLCDSLFPIGSFAYSDGLESAAAAGLVTGAADLGGWLDVCLEEGFVRSDGPAIVHAWPAVEAADWDALIAIDEEVTALRASSTARVANRSMGLRLLKTWQGLYPAVRLEQMLALVPVRRLGPTLPVAFAAVGSCGGVTPRDLLAGFAYTRLAATISAAMRLVSIGQTDAHRLLSVALARVPASIDAVLARPARPESFAPALDIAQINQQYLHARLFRS
ncbi:MAG: urease accessory UreF family protein [Acidobacteriota bacterium]